MSAQPRSLILTRTDIAALMRPADWLAAAEAAFRAAGERRADAPSPLAIQSAQGVFHAKGAGLRGPRPYVALKLNANFPGNPERRGLPTIQGAILLCDGASGAVLAIMDSIEVTLRRTAAATALAARYLARPEAATILICGCGAQGAAQLEALRETLPLTHCLTWDHDPGRAAAFDGAEVSEDLAAAALASDIIVTCTTSRQPFLDRSMVRPGTFVAAVGADSPEKSEIAPALMASAKVVADVLDQCILMGDLNHAIAAGAMTQEAVHAELAGLVIGARPGRTSAEEITLFDSTGMGLQDVAAAAMIYERAAGDDRWPAVALAA
ncbi:MAG TPA: ornithine cyclodeaminase family protein [Allosphingosinicella sp.]|nr:ornithine cyclodeaminase family protein [Allosphingosinicella sp.]